MKLETLWRRSRAATAIALAIGTTVSATACLSGTDPGSPSVPATETYAASLGVDINSMTKVSDDLYYQDITVGEGALVQTGTHVTATYTGWLVNGSQFDSNVGDDPYPLTVGAGEVIVGWDAGLPGMHVGGKRRLVIGSNYGYGPYSYAGIPANSTLIFDVEIVGQ